MRLRAGRLRAGRLRAGRPGAAASAPAAAGPAASVPATCTRAASARAAPDPCDGGTAGCSRPGSLRSTTMSAMTAASSPTAPITREIALLMAHPNPARRPRHQGVMPGRNPAARGHARHLRPRQGGRLHSSLRTGACRHDARCQASPAGLPWPRRCSLAGAASPVQPRRCSQAISVRAAPQPPGHDQARPGLAAWSTRRPSRAGAFTAFRGKHADLSHGRALARPSCSRPGRAPSRGPGRAYRPG